MDIGHKYCRLSIGIQSSDIAFTIREDVFSANLTSAGVYGIAGSMSIFRNMGRYAHLREFTGSKLIERNGSFEDGRDEELRVMCCA